MKPLLFSSLLVIITALSPVGILFGLLARKISQSGRSWWAYCKVLLLIGLAVFLAVYSVSFVFLKTYQSWGLMFLLLVLMLGFIIFFFQKNWARSEKILLAFWGIMVFSSIIFLGFTFSIFYPFLVSDVGMAPAFNKGDFVFCQINRNLLGEYSKGDVVVFREPGDEKKVIIRKIIATEGDEVKINGGQLLVNNQAVRKVQANELIAPVVLAEGQYFVLSEKEKGVIDSKMFGPIVKDDIYVKVLFKLNWLKRWGN